MDFLKRETRNKSGGKLFNNGTDLVLSQKAHTFAEMES
jgi:hypothetical protein